MSTPRKKAPAKAKGTFKDLASKKNPRGGFSFGASQIKVDTVKLGWIQVD